MLLLFLFTSTLPYPPPHPRQVFKYNTSLEKQKIFISGLPFSCTREQLQELCGSHGTVRDVRLVTYRSGKPKVSPPPQPLLLVWWASRSLPEPSCEGRTLPLTLCLPPLLFLLTRGPVPTLISLLPPAGSSLRGVCAGGRGFAGRPEDGRTGV